VARVSTRHDLQLPLEQRRLKRAAKALVAAVGGTADAGEVAGMRQQKVSECTLPNVATFFTLDEALRLEEEAAGSEGWPQVTRALARHHGFALLPTAAGAAAAAWHQSIAEVSREAGDVVAKIVQALADDGEVSAREIVDGGIVEEIDDAIARLAALRGLCCARLGADS
jgi:hypothetical protein